MPDQKVFILSANEKLWLSMSRLLDANGFTMNFASDANRAAKLIDKDRPDLILVDLAEVQESIFPLLEKIDTDFDLSIIPVIAVADPHLSDLQKRVVDAGVGLVLLRPISDERMLMTVRELLESPSRHSRRRYLLQLVFTYTMDDLVQGRLLRLNSGLSSAKHVILGLSVLYLVGGLAALLLLESITGFMTLSFLGVVFLLCPNIVAIPFVHLSALKYSKDMQSLVGHTHRMRFFEQEGIAIQRESDERLREISWKSVEGYLIGEHSILIVTEDSFINIPRRVLASEDQEDRMLQIIKKKSVPYAPTSAHGRITWRGSETRL